MVKATTGNKHQQEPCDWVLTKSLTDEKIEELCVDILDNPKVMSTSLSNEQRYLYTKDQMIEMFRSGALSISSSLSSVFVTEHKATRPPGVYSLLRNMEKGDSLYLPTSKWSSARVAASKLKRFFGSRYSVTKVSPYDKDGDTVEVIREE